MNTAERIAVTLGRLHEMSGDVVHIYDDGYIAWVACSRERHEQLLGAFKEVCPDVSDGRTPDGFYSVFVLPCEPPEREGDFIEHGVMEAMLMLVTDYISDHRSNDLHRIDILLPWVEEWLEEDGGGDLHDGEIMEL
jgi:hypothetical protein